MKAKTKTKNIIIRGISIRVSIESAPKFERLEKELIRKDWEKNSLVD